MVVALSEDQFRWTFPAGGKKVIQKATGIVGNVPTVLTVAAGKIWLLLNVTVILTTDATAVNRDVQVQTRDVADAQKFLNYAQTIGASQTATRNFTREVSATAAIVNSLGFQLLTAAEDLRINISNAVVGDSYDYLVEYLEIDAP